MLNATEDYSSGIPMQVLLGRLQVLGWEYTFTDRELFEMLEAVSWGLEFPILAFGEHWESWHSKIINFVLHNLSGKYQHIAPALKAATEYGMELSAHRHWADKVQELESRPYKSAIAGEFAIAACYALFLIAMYFGDLLSGATTRDKILLAIVSTLILAPVPVTLLHRFKQIRKFRRNANAAKARGLEHSRSLLPFLDQASGISVHIEPAVNYFAGTLAGKIT